MCAIEGFVLVHASNKVFLFNVLVFVLLRMYVAQCVAFAQNFISIFLWCNMLQTHPTIVQLSYSTFPLRSGVWSVVIVSDQPLLQPLLKKLINHYYKMWVQFTSPHSLDQWIHCFFSSPHSLQPVNSLKIQWNHLVYRDTFCCNECTHLHNHSGECVYDNECLCVLGWPSFF
jgi:hypothetical protein